jgi:hypothetical protein
MPCSDAKTGQLFSQVLLEAGIWKTIRSCGKFLLNPTKIELAGWLKDIAELDDVTQVQFLYWPWPLRTCLRIVNSQEAAKTLAEKALRGELGDHDDWLAAEARWARGVGVNDFLAFDQNQLAPTYEI